MVEMENKIVNGIVYNPNKFTISQNKANIKIFYDTPIEYRYRIIKNWESNVIINSNDEIIIRTKTLSKSLWKRFVGISPIAFLNDNKEILRIFPETSVVRFPNGSEVKYDWREFCFIYDSIRIERESGKSLINFQCPECLLFETIIISIFRFWHPINSDS